MSLYWYGPPESKTLRPVVGAVLRKSWVARTLEDALGRLILADGQGRWTRVLIGYDQETYL